MYTNKIISFSFCVCSHLCLDGNQHNSPCMPFRLARVFHVRAHTAQRTHGDNCRASAYSIVYNFWPYGSLSRARKHTPGRLRQLHTNTHTHTCSDIGQVIRIVRLLVSAQARGIRVLALCTVAVSGNTERKGKVDLTRAFYSEPCAYAACVVAHIHTHKRTRNLGQSENHTSPKQRTAVAD